MAALGVTDVGRSSCGFYTFTHELGHNLGLAHDRATFYGPDGPSDSIYVWRPWAYGFTNAVSYANSAHDRCLTTIMAYDIHCAEAGAMAAEYVPLLRFSTPASSWNSIVLGVLGDTETAGVRGPADAVRALRESVHLVAAYRSRPAANRPPELVQRLGARTLAVGTMQSFDVVGVFRDPDGDTLTYTASSQNSGLVAVSVIGTVARLAAGSSAGNTRVTVTATDPGGLSVSSTFNVTVTTAEITNSAPVVALAFSARELSTSAVATLDISPHFRDPDGDDLTYSASSSNHALVAVALEGSMLQLTARTLAGSATVTVTATDPSGLSVSSPLEVTVVRRDTSCARTDLGTLTGSTTRTDTLPPTCPMVGGLPVRSYSFRLVAASELTVAMMSPDLDPVLTLREGTDPRGQVLSRDDDSGGGLNARINLRVHAGVYTLEASSLTDAADRYFTLTITVAATGVWPPVVATEPVALDLECYGYISATHRSYNCPPVPGDQQHMATFAPPVGSPCDQGRVAEFPPGRVVLEIRCRDDASAASRGWSRSGVGPAVFPKPPGAPRVWVRTLFAGDSAHFAVWCGRPAPRLVVNELLGRSWGNAGSHGLRDFAGCRELEVSQPTGQVPWWFVQEPARVAPMPARRWSAPGSLPAGTGLRRQNDWAAAGELERSFSRSAALGSPALLPFRSALPRESGDARLSAAGRTDPLTLGLRCHGYDEGPTRLYHCIPGERDQPLMRTFMPEVGSVCDGGSIAEFPPGRRLFQLVCHDGAPTGAAAWEFSGSGSVFFDKPLGVSRVWVQTVYSGVSAHFAVWCRLPRAALVVNELAGAAWRNDGTAGLYDLAGCDRLEVVAGSPDLFWRFAEEPAPVALWPRRWWTASSLSAGASPAAVEDLEAAISLQR